MKTEIYAAVIFYLTTHPKHTRKNCTVQKVSKAERTVSFRLKSVYSFYFNIQTKFTLR